MRNAEDLQVCSVLVIIVITATTGTEEMEEEWTVAGGAADHLEGGMKGEGPAPMSVRTGGTMRKGTEAAQDLQAEEIRVGMVEAVVVAEDNRAQW